MEIGENIRYLRKQAHLSQKGLAEMTGINLSAIRGYEAGKYKPKKENLMKICSAFNCSEDDIADNSDPASEEKDDDHNADSRYEKITDKLRKGKPLYSPDLYFLCTNYILKYYQNLNEEGMQQAGSLFLDFLEQLNRLSRVPDYQNKNHPMARAGE